jgi:MFS-type transporter involved in bile tolerance (Atg22 family)
MLVGETMLPFLAAVGMINAFGSVAGFTGPYLFGCLNTRTGSLSYGLVVMMVSSLAGALLMLLSESSANRSYPASTAGLVL